MKSILKRALLLIVWMMGLYSSMVRAESKGPEGMQTLNIGNTAPDFNLKGIDGQMHSLADYAGGKVLMVLFTCNHCPTAQAYEGRMKAITADYKEKGVQLIAISPNSPLGLLYEELGYTDLNDDYDEMVIRAKNEDYQFPYLYDGDTETASLKYGPVATPHAFVFDKDRKLTYTGRLDKSEKPGTANAEDLGSGIDATLAGQAIAEPVTKTFGCSVKWGWKIDGHAAVDEAWAARPVELEKAGVKEIKQIIANADSKKLRLVNVWATWCGPCTLEYPDFLVLQRMYGARDFEFVSISADKPDKAEKVLEFLKTKQSGVKNYLFSGEDTYELIEAIDKNWNGALPYTMLIEPGGKVVWSQQGQIDIPELKRRIVAHEMIGRTY